jgi:hypothetical protein
MIYLKQSTASQEVLLGPFVDSTDGVTAETGLTIANTDIKIHKAGATTLANKNSGGATHISNGNYYAVLDATDTDTVGSGAIVVQVSGALAVRHNFTVLPGAVFDAMIGGTAGFPLASGIKKGVALTKFQFLMTDSTNHNPATGLTVSGFVSKDGGAFSALTDSVTEVANGTYEADVSATEMNANNVTLRFTATGADDLVVTLRADP